MLNNDRRALKSISYNSEDKMFAVRHGNDENSEVISINELKKSVIGEAINKGCLFRY